jgi:magnesium transporter
MQNSIAYNENYVEYGGKLEGTQKGFKLWLDIVNPTTSEISEIAKSFDLDKSAIEALEHKSKKPQVRVLDNHKFTIILDIKYKTFEDLVTESIYLFHGSNWLITIHSDKVDLLINVSCFLNKRTRR